MSKIFTDMFKATPLTGSLLLGAATWLLISASQRRWEVAMFGVGIYQLRILEIVAGPANVATYLAAATLPALAVIPVTSLHIVIFTALLVRFCLTVPMSGYAGTMWLALAALQLLSEDIPSAGVGAASAVILLIVPFLRDLQLGLGRSLNRILRRSGLIRHETRIEQYRAVLVQPPERGEQLLPLPGQNFQATARRRPVPGHQENQASTMAQPEPKEEDVNFLTGMGYSRSDAIKALVMTQGDLNQATNVLLDQLLH